MLNGAAHDYGQAQPQARNLYVWYIQISCLLYCRLLIPNGRLLILNCCLLIRKKNLPGSENIT